MALTKPAGCVLQILTAPIAIAGLWLIMTGLAPQGSIWHAIFGTVLLSLGLAPIITLGLQDLKTAK